MEIKLHKNEMRTIKRCLESLKHFNYNEAFYDRIIKKINKALTKPKPKQP